MAAKQPVYDQTMKSGKQLKDKAPKSDENTLKTMMSDMKTKWTTVCSKAVERFVVKVFFVKLLFIICGKK